MVNPATREAAKVLELFPHFGATALFKKHTKTEIEPLAATDGTTVYLSPRYFGLARSERHGVLLHEYLHCVLSHPQRAGILKLAEGLEFCGKTVNVAADALINHVIRREAQRRSRHLALPANLYYFDMVITELEQLGVVTPQSMKPDNTSMEALYFLLKRAKQIAEQLLGEGPGDAGEGRQAGRRVEAARKIQAWCSQDADLVPADGSYDELTSQIRTQNEINASSASTYGHVAASLLDAIKGDIPKSKTPWERVLRHLGSRFLSRKRRRSPRKPSGNMLSQEAIGDARFWDAGRRRSPDPRALVIADSSGSIDMRIYGKFLGELDRMRKRTNATFDFVTADTKMYQPCEVTDATDLKKLRFEGRGGTSFIEPLRRAEQGQYDLVIYMTDLEGAFPKKCKLPVIWAAPIDKAEKHAVPFGRVIAIQ